MATRYNNFSVFMADVTEHATRRASHMSLVYYICVNILKSTGGWPLLLAICAMLTLSSIAFGVAITTFLITPLGLIIMGFGGGAVLWKLYKEKALPLAIKKIGQQYKERYEQASGSLSQIDSLFDKAVDDLFCELAIVNRDK